MRGSFWLSQSSRAPLAVAIVSLALMLLVLLPSGSLAASANGPPHSMARTSVSDPLSANATWDGVNLQTASTSSSAFQIHFNGAVDIRYNWTSNPAAPLYTVNDARLQIFYFGFALATRDVTDANPVAASGGSFDMSWTTGPLQYILEGTYRVVASLLEPNGTTVWSQTFWVQVAAPYYVLAALPIVLILITLYELYGIATAGRQAALQPKKKSAPPPATPPPAETPDTPVEPPAGGGS